MFLRFVLSYAFLMIVGSYELCPTAVLDKSQFTLGSLNEQDPKTTILNGNVISISPCKLIKCSTDQTKQAFIISTNSSLCQPYTLNSNPLKEGYSLIDNSNPSTGIKIQYLPNKDIVNSKLYQTVLVVKCNQQTSKTTQCTETSQVNSTSGLTEYKLTCTIYHVAGCPSTALNYFWTFLSKNSIPFAITIWVISLVELLLSYFIIRITIFLFGIVSGLIFGIIFIAQTYSDFLAQSNAICIAIILLSLIIGILFGICLLTMPRFGYMNIGLLVAVVIGLMLQNAVFYLTKSLLAFYIFTGVFALIMIIMALLCLRFYIIISTAFLSSFGMIRPLGFFLPHYPNQLTSFYLNSTPWQFYLYLIGVVVLTILGCAFQICLLRCKGQNNENNSYYLENNDSLSSNKQKNWQKQEKLDCKQKLNLRRSLFKQKNNNQQLASYIEMEKIKPKNRQSSQNQYEPPKIANKKPANKKKKKVNTSDEEQQQQQPAQNLKTVTVSSKNKNKKK